MVTEYGVTRNKEKAKNVEIEQRNIEQKKEKKKRKIKGRLGYLHPLLYFTVDCPQSFDCFVSLPSYWGCKNLLNINK